MIWWDTGWAAITGDSRKIKSDIYNKHEGKESNAWNDDTEITNLKEHNHFLFPEALFYLKEAGYFQVQFKDEFIYLDGWVHPNPS